MKLLCAVQMTFAYMADGSARILRPRGTGRRWAIIELLFTLRRGSNVK